MRVIFLTTITFLALSAEAADWKGLEGTYAVTAKNMVSEFEDSHYKIQLVGESAMDLFDAMKVTPEPDDCTGAQSKIIGNMQCLFYEGKGEYECSFSLNIAEQKIEEGISC